MADRAKVQKEIESMNRRMRNGTIGKREYYKAATVLYQTRARIDIEDLASDGYVASEAVVKEVMNPNLVDEINIESQFNRIKDRFRRDRIKTNARKTVTIDQWRVGAETAPLTKPIEIKIPANTRNETRSLAKELTKKVNQGLDYAVDHNVNQDVARTFYDTIVGASANLGTEVYTGDTIDLANMKEDIKDILNSRRVSKDVIKNLDDDEVESYTEDLKSILQIPHLGQRTYADYRQQRSTKAYYTLMGNLGVSVEIADMLRIAVNNSAFWQMLEDEGFDSEQKRRYFAHIASATKMEVDLNGKNSVILGELLTAAINTDFSEFDRILKTELGTTIYSQPN